MPLDCPRCNASLEREEASALRRHAEQVHGKDPAMWWKCMMPGCDGAQTVLLSPAEIIDHHCAHFRFRQRVREFVAPEDEADVPSFEPAAVVAPIAEREDAFFDEAVVPYDSWFLDLAAWDPA